MNRRLTWTTAAALVIGMLGLTGCVAQRQADDMRTLYRKSQEQIIDLRAQLEEANSRVAALQHGQVSPEQLQKLQSQRDQLRKALADAEARLRQASQQQIVLPPSLDNALRQLAQQHPDLMTYDASLGMVKFQSDLTFPLGSAQVSSEAVQTLGNLAQVLNSPAARGYEVRIVGHTDNVPVTNPATKARHPDNWYLSVDRAIAVEHVLQRAGVPPERMGVAGYGQYRPIVPNGPHGAQANRRVEIYLVPMPSSGAPQTAGQASAQPQSTAGQPGQTEPPQQPQQPGAFK